MFRFWARSEDRPAAESDVGGHEEQGEVSVTDVSASADATPPPGDEPIARAAQDLLGRARYAGALARAIERLDLSSGSVIGITGPWGSGKTSLLNMCVEQLALDGQTIVVEFNPWLFAGPEQLTSVFFAELGAQLRDQEGSGARARRVGADVIDKLGMYSKAFAPLRVVPGAGGVLDAVGSATEQAGALIRGDQSISARRDALTAALASSPARVVVLLDDIDRLTRDEIRDVFRLVRLTGSFPNILYIVCFDRAVVEDALREEGFDGRTYLEKILRLSISVPATPDVALSEFLLQGIQSAVDATNGGPFQEDRWPDVYYRIVRPLCETLRDAKRLIASLPVAIEVAGTEVAVVDVVALEAVRTTLPDVHARIVRMRIELTSTRAPVGATNADDDLLRARVGELVASHPDYRAVVESLIELLFPAANRHLGGSGHDASWESVWRSERRVAERHVFNYYVSSELPGEIAPADHLDRIASAFGDESALRDAFAEVPDAYLEDVLERLESVAEEAEADEVEATVAVLVTLYPRLRTKSVGMFDFGADLRVDRIVLRLLRRITDDASRASIASRLVANAPTLYAKSTLIRLVGYREGEGHQLVPPGDATELEDSMRELVLSAPADVLAHERDLLRTVATWTSDNVERHPANDALTDPRVVARMLTSGVTTSRSQAMGSAHVRVEPRLVFDLLVRLYGGESALGLAVEDLRSELGDDHGTVVADSDLVEALDLYDRYASGWRPPER